MQYSVYCITAYRLRVNDRLGFLKIFIIFLMYFPCLSYYQIKLNAVPWREISIIVVLVTFRFQSFITTATAMTRTARPPQPFSSKQCHHCLYHTTLWRGRVSWTCKLLTLEMCRTLMQSAVLAAETTTCCDPTRVSMALACDDYVNVLVFTSLL